MSDDATEFAAEISPNARGGWKWKLVTVNGRWPHTVGTTRMDEIKTSGSTISKWGARAEARRALKIIRRNREIEPEVVS